MEMDGMKAVSIPTGELKKVKFAGSLNYSRKTYQPIWLWGLVKFLIWRI